MSQEHLLLERAIHDKEIQRHVDQGSMLGEGERHMSAIPKYRHGNQGSVFDLFEGYALSSVLAGLEMSGDLSTLATAGIDPWSIQGRNSREKELLAASLRYLRQRGVTNEAGGTFTLTSFGEAVYRDRGFLLWLVGGYGEPMRRLDALLSLGQRYGEDVNQDGRWVAAGTTLMAKPDILPDAMALLGTLSFDTVLDLGCGDATFLTSVCRKFDARGIGVDLSQAAYAEAGKTVADAGLADQIRLIHANVKALDEISGLGDIQLVLAFFLLHEFLAVGKEALIGYLSGLSRRVPPGTGLVIGEVEPPTGEDDSAFTPEFALVHALKGQRLLSADDWAEVLAAGGFTLSEVVRTAFPGAILLHARSLA